MTTSTKKKTNNNQGRGEEVHPHISEGYPKGILIHEKTYNWGKKTTEEMRPETNDRDE